MNNLFSKMLGCALASTLLPLQFAYAQIEKDLPKNHERKFGSFGIITIFALLNN